MLRELAVWMADRCLASTPEVLRLTLLTASPVADDNKQLHLIQIR
jgi:hypothetical protein